MKNLTRFIFSAGRHQGGIALMEFAFVLPFILLILYGGIELTRFMIIAQKVDKASYALADITNQYTPATIQRNPGEIDVGEMNDVVFAQFQSLMEPYDAATMGVVIISSIQEDSGVTRIKWQVAGGGNYSDGETVSAVSGLAPAAINGAGAALKDRPASFTGDIATQMASITPEENMVVSEVFFRYQPFLDEVLSGLSMPFTLGEITLARRTFSRPRIGDLVCLPETFVYSSDC